MADRQKNVMVVSSSQKAEEYLVDVLSEEKRYAISVARSAEDAKKIMFKTRVDAVLDVYKRQFYERAFSFY